jgi:hypothetical protein
MRGGWGGGYGVYDFHDQEPPLEFITEAPKLFLEKDSSQYSGVYSCGMVLEKSLNSIILENALKDNSNVIDYFFKDEYDTIGSIRFNDGDSYHNHDDIDYKSSFGCSCNCFITIRCKELASCEILILKKEKKDFESFVDALFDAIDLMWVLDNGKIRHRTGRERRIVEVGNRGELKELVRTREAEWRNGQISSNRVLVSKDKLIGGCPSFCQEIEIPDSNTPLKCQKHSKKLGFCFFGHDKKCKQFIELMKFSRFKPDDVISGEESVQLAMNYLARKTDLAILKYIFYRNTFIKRSLLFFINKDKKELHLHGRGFVPMCYSDMRIVAPRCSYVRCSCTLGIQILDPAFIMCSRFEIDRIPNEKLVGVCARMFREICSRWDIDKSKELTYRSESVTKMESMLAMSGTTVWDEITITAGYLVLYRNRDVRKYSKPKQVMQRVFFEEFEEKSCELLKCEIRLASHEERGIKL